MHDDERGQVTPLLAVAVVLLAVLALGIGRLGVAVADRARAGTAADAAALAAVVDGRPGAEALARANGGRVVDFDRVGADVVVTVRVGAAEATARARPATAPP